MTSNHSERVRLSDPEHMNLLGMLLKGLLEANLRDEKLFETVRSLRGDIALRAGSMEVTLCFEDEGIAIVAGRSPSPRAEVTGEMGALVKMVNRKAFVSPVLLGAIRPKGDLFFLLRAFPVLLAPARDNRF